MDRYKRNDIENQLHHPIKGKIINLSQETLSISDYEWLGRMIQCSSFIEEIILPTISKQDCEIALSILNQATIKNSTLTTLNLDLSALNGDINENIELMYNRIQSRLKRNQNKIFAIHGGGNIGLGLMADIISQSEFDYHIIATSSNELNTELINSVNSLCIQHGTSNNSETTTINNVKIIPRTRQHITRLYGEACLAAICVTPAVLPSIARDIAYALITRYKTDGSGLKILILMNIPNCDKFVYEKIYTEIFDITNDKIRTENILSCIEFVPTVIDRIVTPIHPDKIRDQLRLQLVEKIKNSIYDENDLENEIESILQNPKKLAKLVYDLGLKFNLFNAEKAFSMYVNDNFPEAHRLPAIKTTKDLYQLEAVKNKYINGPHAILAWIGALLGCTTISESIKHPYIFTLIRELMENEISPILRAEFPEVSNKELKSMEDLFFERCTASIDDPVTRVGRDPLRKLDSGGRIRGTIELAEKHQLNIVTPRLEQGIAAGFLYAVKGIDPTNSSCQKILEIYKGSNNSFSAALCYTGDSPSGSFSGLNPYKDRMLLDNVLNKISELNHLTQSTSITKKSQLSTTLTLSESKSTSCKAPSSTPRTFIARDNFFIFSLSNTINLCTRNKNSLPAPLSEVTKNKMIALYKKHLTIWNSVQKNENLRRKKPHLSITESRKTNLLNK